MVLKKYRITNLQQVIEAAQAIHNEACAHAGRQVHPSEIVVLPDDWEFVEFELESSKLTDGSHVYNVVVIAE